MRSFVTRRTFLIDAVLCSTVFLPIAGQLTEGDAATHHTITIESFVFAPESVEVKPGDTITWVNKDIVPHTATAVDGSWNTGSLATNEQATVLVTSLFVTDYFCEFHPGMKGELRMSAI